MAHRAGTVPAWWATRPERFRTGTLGDFSARVMAVTLKAALDGLLALDPALGLDAYWDELVALFDRAARPG